MNPYLPLHIYIAAPFEERPMAMTIKKRLEEAGAVVTSTWLTDQDGNDQNMARISGKHHECLVRAVADLKDIDDANVLVLYKPKELHRMATTCGHAHEVQYALDHGKLVVILGDRENVFHYLPTVHVAQSLDSLVAFLHLDG